MVNALNRIGALEWIAIAQANVGYLDDARKTASMIEHSEEDWTQDGARERALFAIALVQIKANDVEGAVRTALSVRYYLQYRDDALHKIVEHEIAKRDLKRALVTAEKLGNPSRKATAILQVATAHATSGDRKTAGNVAARVELTQADELLATAAEQRFDYRLPGTWGVCYEPSLTGTNASRRAAHRRAAEVAAAAMALSQALEERPAQSYALLFDEINTEEVVQALARSHAASGDSNKALAWARQIGGSCKLTSSDSRYRSAVERRIHALIGVAEGILDRSIEGLPKKEP